MPYFGNHQGTSRLYPGRAEAPTLLPRGVEWTPQRCKWEGRLVTTRLSESVFELKETAFP
jgi:hypothetical protein